MAKRRQKMSDAIKKLAASELAGLGKDFREAVESNQLGSKVLHDLEAIHDDLGAIHSELGAIRRLLEKQLDGEPKAAKPVESAGRKRKEGQDEWWRGKDVGLSREESEAAYGPPDS